MKICIAQIKSEKGNLSTNIKKHKQYIQQAIELEANCIFFPELSISAYEPHLATKLAINPNDTRFNSFQNIADNHQITIGLGIPLKNNLDVHISMMIIKPNLPIQFYSKKYLHPDEEPFFKSGKNKSNKIELNEQIALAICYEISIPEHASTAHQSGAKIYLASVAKTKEGVLKAQEQLSNIAKQYSMTTLMVNAIGPSDNFINAGQSSIWNKEGILLEKLDATSEGFLILDTETNKVLKRLSPNN